MSEERFFWLSFCDTDRPTGQQFLGVAIVNVTRADVTAIKAAVRAKYPNAQDGAEWIVAASRKAWDAGCNPGGEMYAAELPFQKLPARVPLCVLMSREQLRELDLIGPDD